MNHLAHLYLAGPDAELRAGGVLGDFVRGRLRGAYPARIEQGIALHRRIDAVTDAHPRLREIVSSLPSAHRRWAPVALDVFLDHLLARDFEVHAGQSLAHFAADALDDLDRYAPLMPEPAQRFVTALRSYRTLERYADPEAIPRVLERLSTRTRHSHAILDLVDDFATIEDALVNALPVVLSDLEAAAGPFRAPADQQLDSPEQAPPGR